MPEMHFTIEWPSGKRERCYSPSYIIEDYFVPGRTYPVPEFLERAASALEGASERVRQTLRVRLFVGARPAARDPALQRRADGGRTR